MKRSVPSHAQKTIQKLFSQTRPSPAESMERLTLTNPKADFGQDADVHVVAALGILDAIPDGLFVLDLDEFSNYRLAVSHLRVALEKWRRDVGLRVGSTSFPGIKAQVNPVTVILFCLSQCPDEIPSKETVELSFLAPPDLRESIRLDVSEAHAATRDGRWKTATVLAGAAIEALLFWAIGRCSDEKLRHAKEEAGIRGSIERWHLSELVRIAGAMELITEGTVKQANLAKDARNLIHPGREVRLKECCDRGTAHAGLAAIYRVANDLSCA